MNLTLESRIGACHVVSLPEAEHRRAHMTALLDQHGIDFSFSDGVQAASHDEACARAHQAALAKVRRFPALVLEDDVSLTGSDMTLPPWPGDADIIYLGATPFGCLPRKRAYVRRFGHRAHYGLALASEATPHWLRLHSMVGAIAILYVSEKGLETWRRATQQGLRNRAAFDVFTAYAMNSLNV